MNHKGMFYTNVDDYETKEDMMNDFITLRMYDMAKDKEIERLNNIINELENLIKEDIITNLCEIENKRIGYGQTETDKIWLHNLWGFKKYIINRCDEILKGENK